jgi:hypothetical protein
MRTIFLGLLATAALFICAFMILFLKLYLNGELTVEHSAVVEYKDFISILLTAIAVMIAIATAVAAMAAVWGYGAIREELNRTVAKTAGDRAEEIARSRIDVMVPQLVAEQMAFEKQGTESRGDDVAEEISKEVGGGKG